MPLKKGCLKVKCMEKIYQYIESYPNINDYYVSVCGDMKRRTRQSDNVRLSWFRYPKEDH
jgi:hypothetical protein